jgi:ankyrin repeat protein
MNNLDILENKLNFNGDTVMHLVCYKNNIEMVQYLKKIGANFNIKNNNGKYPIDLTNNN